MSMRLHTRLKRLEAAAMVEMEEPPSFLIQFIEATRDRNGLPRPGKCVGGLRIIPGQEKQWLDAKMNPLPPPAYMK